MINRVRNHNMSNWKSLLLAGTIALAPVGHASLAAAQEAPEAEAVTEVTGTETDGAVMTEEAKAKMQREMDEVIALVEKIFDTSDLPPVEPARLALAERTSAALVPPGSLEKMMDNMYGKFLSTFMGELGGTSDIMLSIKTGVESEKLAELDDKSKNAVSDMFDPYRVQREEQALKIIRPLVSEALADMEAPMRAGLAKAYARKFSAEQLTEMNGFFATPTGKFYAAESLALQADPEVMVAMVRAVPALVGKFIDRAPDIEAQFKSMEELPKEKQLADFSEAELKKLAKLLKVDVKTLKEHRDMWATAGEDDSIDMEAAEAAADAAADAVYDDPSWDRANWAAADVERVEALEDASDIALSAVFEAREAAIANARKKLGLPDSSE